MNTGAGRLSGGISGVQLDGCACGLVLLSVGEAGLLVVALLSVRVLGILLALPSCTCVKDYFDRCSVASFYNNRIGLSRAFRWDSYFSSAKYE